MNSFIAPAFKSFRNPSLFNKSVKEGVSCYSIRINSYD